MADLSPLIRQDAANAVGGPHPDPARPRDRLGTVASTERDAADIPLEVRFVRAMRALGIGDRPAHLLVAFSGGLDSTSLLYLLRFHTDGLPFTITAAHLDHRMRRSSTADAAWVRGICAAWEVPLHLADAPAGLTGETDARDARYRFLRETAERVGADRILTGHHADDQAETVLFRILRGTGIDGLAGIPAVTPSGVARPLLGVWRQELEEFARSRGLTWREDPTNLWPGPSRNRLRLEILPTIEREVAPAARRNLVALADLARESEDGWRAVVRGLYPKLVTVDREALLVARNPLRGYHPALVARVVRKALRHFGIVPNRVGTRSVVTFITEAPSGRVLELAAGVRISSEFDRVRIERNVPIPPDSPALIPFPEGPGIFRAEARLGGVRYRVEARRATFPDTRDGGRWLARVPIEASAFPLTLRARAAGDRFTTPGGTKSVKKLLIEHRVPGGDRARLPILADASGAVVWIAGIGLGADRAAAGAGTIEISVREG